MKDRGFVVRSAEDCKAEMGCYGISVEAFEDVGVEEALSRTRRPNSTVRLAVVAELRARNLEVIPTRGAPHATVLLPEPLDDEGWLALQDAFDEPRLNPYAPPRR